MVLPGCAFQSKEGIDNIIQFQVINTDWRIRVIEIIKKNRRRTERILAGINNWRYGKNSEEQDEEQPVYPALGQVTIYAIVPHTLFCFRSESIRIIEIYNVIKDINIEAINVPINIFEK